METQAKRFQKIRMTDFKSRMTLKVVKMDKKEAFSIAEEILKMLAKPNNHYQENMREYICERLDISDECLSEVLNVTQRQMMI